MSKEPFRLPCKQRLQKRRACVLSYNHSESRKTSPFFLLLCFLISRISSVYMHQGGLIQVISVDGACGVIHKHHLNHKHPWSAQLPAALHCALMQSRGGSWYTWLHKAELKMCLLPPSSLRHSAGLFYCHVVKCHLGSHVPGGVFHPFTKFELNILQRHLSWERCFAKPVNKGK